MVEHQKPSRVKSRKQTRDPFWAHADRVATASKYASFVGGGLGIVGLIILLIVNTDPIQVSDIIRGVILLPSCGAATCAGITSSFLCLFAPSAVFNSFMGEEILSTIGTRHIFVARIYFLLLFLLLCFFIGVIALLLYRAF
ncbi:hypothetical protein N9Y42_04720 [Mariniblastus sp.]|nr:hypothetical protein [Mariniblastus sp.]